MRALCVTLCAKRRLGLHNVGPALADIYKLLGDIDISNVPSKDSALRFNLEFLECWKYDIAQKLAISKVSSSQEHINN